MTLRQKATASLCSPRGAKIGGSSYVGFSMDFTKLTHTDQRVMVHLNS